MNDAPVIENISTVKQPSLAGSIHMSQSQNLESQGSPRIGAEDIDVVQEVPLDENMEEGKEMVKPDPNSQKNMKRKKSKKWKSFSTLQRREQIDKNDPTNQPFIPTEDFLGPKSKLNFYLVNK